jgi:PIN domain nuclease of toxin-antitoxin system
VLFDRLLLVAQARIEDFTILSSDKAFRKHGVEIVWQSG